MKRRLTIARSLINEPELLLLDEPTTGLDPQARHALWDRLYRLKQQGVTLVLTTHYMDEAEQLCDRLVVMDDGRIVAEGSPRSLIEQHSTREVARAALRPGRARGPGREGGRPRRPQSRCCPTGSSSTPTTAKPPSSRCTTVGCARRARWCGGARWRTSSCGSPAARWWSDDGGRARLDGRRRTTPPAVRAMEYYLLAYRRTWRGTVVDELPQPGAVPGRHGSRARRARRPERHRRSRRRRLRRVHRSRSPGLRGHADRRGRVELARCSAPQVDAHVPRPDRLAARAGRRGRRALPVRHLPPPAGQRRLPPRDGAVRRHRRRGPPCWPSRRRC